MGKGRSKNPFALEKYWRHHFSFHFHARSHMEQYAYIFTTLSSKFVTCRQPPYRSCGNNVGTGSGFHFHFQLQITNALDVDRAEKGNY